ncbi:MAG: DoxX family membrane protein, partial [Acidobacteria bacterium]|nr:DoxX family membrane protein [Acidobacteriota bacterium]
MFEGKQSPALRILEWFCRLALGGLFLYAGYVKIRDPFLFEMAVDSYRLLPSAGVIWVTRSLPWLEVVLGALLVSGWKLRYASSFTALLLGGFLVAMGVAYARGVEANCGCFGTGERISPLTLGRDSLLFAMALSLAVYSW